MPFHISSLPALPEAKSGVADHEEAERARRLTTRMTEAKRALNGVLANLARLEASMVTAKSDDLVN